jgi:transcriptional regulator with XRE-family HTH domain
MSRSAIARLEQGRGDRLTLATLEAVAAALDARFVWRLDWHGEALDRLVDEGHAALVDRVVALLTLFGWQCATEVSFSVFGERGAYDVLAFYPRLRILLVVEVKTALGDNQATLMVLDRKTRLAMQVARGRGWAADSVATVLVLPETSTARRRIRALGATYASALPDRGADLTRWLRRPIAAPLAGVWFVSPGSQAVARRAQRVRRRTPEREPSSDDRPTSV